MIGDFVAKCFVIKMKVGAGEALVGAMRRIGWIAMRSTVDVEPGEDDDLVGTGLKFEAGTLQVAAFEIEDELFATSDALQGYSAAKACTFGKFTDETVFSNSLGIFRRRSASIWDSDIRRNKMLVSDGRDEGFAENGMEQSGVGSVLLDLRL